MEGAPMDIDNMSASISTTLETPGNNTFSINTASTNVDKNSPKMLPEPLSNTENPDTVNTGSSSTPQSSAVELSTEMLASYSSTATVDTTDILKPPLPSAVESNIAPVRQRTPVEDVTSNADADEILSFGSLSEVSPGKVSSIASTPEPMLVVDPPLAATIKSEVDPSAVQPRSRSSSQSSKTKSPSAKKKKPPKPKNDENMQDGRNDFYCWACHREGEVLCCELCPRVFHAKCMRLDQEPEGDWHCPECQKVMQVECKGTQSRAMSQLNIDQLALHLRYALQRMKTTGSEPFLEPVDTKTFSDYLEYVFHPMDLSTLEKNIKKRKYGSTDAFLADVKWILHNCVIYNGLQTKLTHIAKTMVKIAQHEMSEIEVCPECYLNSCRKRENWFCEPCKEPHILVWAKLQGFPHWPAKALRIDKGMVDARFFGQHDRAWIALSACYLMSKEMPLPVKNKKKGRGPGAKGGLDNAMMECQHYIDNVVKKYGEYDYAPPRTPLTHMDLYRKTTDNKDVLKGLDFSGKIENFKIKEENIEAQSKSSDGKFLNLNLGNSDVMDEVTASAKKKSKVVTTSGAHPRTMKKFAPKKKASMAFLEKTIESCKNSLLESIQNDCDESTTDESDSSSDEEDAKKSANHDKNWEESNTVENDDSDNELTMDIGEGKSNKNKKESAASNLAEKGLAKIKKKSVADGDSKSFRSKSILVRKDGDLQKKSSSSLHNPKGAGGSVKRKLDEDSSSNLPAGKITKVDPSHKKKQILLLAEPPKSREIDGGKIKKFNDSGKTKLISTSQVVRKKSILKTDDGKGDKNLKSAAKLLAQKVMNRKTHPEKSYEEKSRSSVNEPSKKLSSFTIPKHKPSASILKKPDSDTPSDKPHHAGKSQSFDTPHSPNLNFPMQKLQKYNDKVMHGVQQVLVEMYEDMMVLMDDKSGKTNQHANEELAQVRLELEKLKWLHKQQVAELQHNHDLTIAEIRQSLENDKMQQLNDTKGKYEKEKRLAVEETKRKQWCANCGKEAIFYCCWNTSYCDYPCQQLHWPKHLATCSQAQNAASAIATPTTPKEINPLADLPAVAHPEEHEEEMEEEPKTISAPEEKPQKMEESTMSEAEDEVEDSDNDDMVIDESGPKETPGSSGEQVSVETPEDSRLPPEKTTNKSIEVQSEPVLPATTASLQDAPSIDTDSKLEDEKLSETVEESVVEKDPNSEPAAKELKKERISAENKEQLENVEEEEDLDKLDKVDENSKSDTEKDTTSSLQEQEGNCDKVPGMLAPNTAEKSPLPTEELLEETPTSPDLLTLGDDPPPVIDTDAVSGDEIEEKMDIVGSEGEEGNMFVDEAEVKVDKEKVDEEIEEIPSQNITTETKSADSLTPGEVEKLEPPSMELVKDIEQQNDVKNVAEDAKQSHISPIFADSYLTSLQNLNPQNSSTSDKTVETHSETIATEANG